MQARDIQGVFERCVAAMKADPKKAGILGVLVIILGAFWIRAIGAAAGPAKASASIVPVVSPGVTIAPAAPITPVHRLLREWAKGPIAPMSRNLFYINYEAFPSDGTKKPKPDAVGKSASSVSEDQNRREKVEAFKKDAEDLRLQSILLGAEPKALVEGRLVREGDVVANFRVRKIGARSVIVERDGIRLEIKLK